MSAFNSIKLKDLNQISEVKTTDFLIIENENGTNLLPVTYFIMQNNNISFYTAFKTVSGQKDILLTNTTTQLSSISSVINNTIRTNINDLSATIRGSYNRVFHAAGTLTIPASATTSQNIVINTTNVTLSVFDLVMGFISEPFFSSNPASNYRNFVVPASGHMVVFSSLSAQGPFQYNIRANMSNISTSAVYVSYRIIKPY